MQPNFPMCLFYFILKTFFGVFCKKNFKRLKTFDYYYWASLLKKMYEFISWKEWFKNYKSKFQCFLNNFMAIIFEEYNHVKKFHGTDIDYLAAISLRFFWIFYPSRLTEIISPS